MSFFNNALLTQFQGRNFLPSFRIEDRLIAAASRPHEQTVMRLVE